jgi:hypothetical protein
MGVSASESPFSSRKTHDGYLVPNLDQSWNIKQFQKALVRDFSSSLRRRDRRKRLQIKGFYTPIFDLENHRDTLLILGT